MNASYLMTKWMNHTHELLTRFFRNHISLSRNCRIFDPVLILASISTPFTFRLIIVDSSDSTGSQHIKAGNNKGNQQPRRKRITQFPKASGHLRFQITLMFIYITIFCLVTPRIFVGSARQNIGGTCLLMIYKFSTTCTRRQHLCLKRWSLFTDVHVALSQEKPI
jgi:hypothetical protein